MDKQKVYLIEQKEYDAYEIMRKVKPLLEELKPSGKKVLLKPSFVYPNRNAVSAITHPRLISGVVKALNEVGAGKIMVGEGPVLGCARYHFSRIGKIEGAEEVYFDEERRVSVRIKNPFIHERFTVPKCLLESDIFISLPKLKTNLFSGITLSIKNNFGFLLIKDRYIHHDDKLHKYLADLYKVRPPDFVITDAIIAGEGQGPLEAEPFHLGLLICGKNAIAVDSVSSHIIGVDPLKIEHLSLLSSAGFGPVSLEEIEVDGKIEKRNFKLPSYSLKIDACIPGCLGMLQQVLDSYKRKYGKAPQFNIIAGRSVREAKKGSLVYGNCAEEYKKYGKFVRGCPPRAEATVLAVQKVSKIRSPYWDDCVDIPLLMKSYMKHLFRRLLRVKIK